MIRCTDELAYEWWRKMSAPERMRRLDRKLSRPGVYRISWTKLLKTERDLILSYFRNQQKTA